MNIIKTISILLITGLGLNLGYAQSLENEVLTSAGTMSSASNGTSLTWSLGELIVGEFDAGTNGKLGHGHQNILVQQTVNTKELAALSVSIKVYPNPTVNTVNIELQELNKENLEAKLLDLNGKELQQLPLQNQNTSINMQALPKGVYLLHIQSATQQQNTYKIIKQ